MFYDGGRPQTQGCKAVNHRDFGVRTFVHWNVHARHASFVWKQFV